MQFALGFIVGVVLMMVVVMWLPNAVWKTKTKLKQLDPLHWSLLVSLFVVAGAGWWAACQASAAREASELTRRQYFRFLTNSQSHPIPAKELR